MTVLKSERAKIYALDLKEKLYNRNRRKVCVFIGAGASFSSGCIDFDSLKREISKTFGKNIEENDIETYFSKLFLGIKPHRRSIFIKDFFNLDSPPSDGYIYLALLAKLKLVDFVITTNFDFFIERAGEVVSEESNIYEVYIPHRLKDDLDLEDLDSSKIPIFKIHGDCNNGIFDITHKELNNDAYPDNVKNIVQKVFKTHDVIFIGYGGHEKKLKKTLMPIVDELNDICWFNPQPAKEATKLYDIIEDKLLYEDIPTDESDLYFENVMREIALTVIESNENFLKDINAKFLTYDIIKNQVKRWNKLKLSPRINDDKDSISLDDIFINRKNTEEEISNFVGTEKILFVLVGKSGFGKTTLLTKIALDYEKSGDICLFIPLRILPRDLITNRSAKKNSLKNGQKSFLREIIAPYLGMINMDLSLLAQELDKRKGNVYIILDGLNEFSPKNFQDCENLYKKIYESACELKSLSITRVKFIISCRNETWHQLQKCHLGLPNDTIFYNKGRPIILNQFDPSEFKEAYGKYKKVYQVKTDYEKLLPLARERLMNPFMLNLTCVAKEGGVITFDTPSIDIYNQFFNIKFETIYDADIDVPFKFLTEFAQKCFEKLDTILEISAVPSRPDENLLRYLIDLNILSKDYNENNKQIYYFAHDRFFEFFLSEALREIQIETENDLENLLFAYKRDNFFHLLQGALKFVMLSRRDVKLFTNLLNAKNDDVKSIFKDVLFEISQSNPNTFKETFSRYTSSRDNTTTEGMRILLQATSLNTDLKDLVFNIMKHSGDPYLQAEANYFFISLCIKELNEKKFKLIKSNIIRTLWLDKTNSGWLNVVILLSTLTRLSWDNFEGNIKKYFQLMGELLKESFMKVSRSDILGIAKNLEMEEFTKKYFFSAKNIKAFFERPYDETANFQKFIDLLVRKDITLEELLEWLKIAITCEHKISRMIAKIVLIFLAKRYPEEIKRFLSKQLADSGTAKEGNTLSALAAYISIANGVIDYNFIYRMNEFFLNDRTDMLAYETSYERLFNPIGTYGFIFPIKNKGKAIDLFYKYINVFLEKKESKLLLRVLHALRQSISLFPEEGLETLQPFLNYNEDVEVRQRMISVLAESYARSPEITNIYLNKYEAYFSREEQQIIKFGVDHKIYAHSITILEWARVYNSLFSNSNAYIHTHKVLTFINQAKSIENALEKLVNYIKEST